MEFNPSILYEDSHVIAVNKPCGMLTQGDATGDLDLLSALKGYIKERDNKPGNVFLGLVQRLDRPVSGVVVFAKRSKAASRISEQLRQRKMDKSYLAITDGEVEGEGGRLVNMLKKDSQERVTRVVESGGREAVLEYSVLGRSNGMSLVEVDLITGVSHQIRVQLSVAGYPILGDTKYGCTKRGGVGKGAIALHCHRIGFRHPTEGFMVTVEAETEPWWPFGRNRHSL